MKPGCVRCRQKCHIFLIRSEQTGGKLSLLLISAPVCCKLSSLNIVLYPLIICNNLCCCCCWWKCRCLFYLSSDFFSLGRACFHCSSAFGGIICASPPLMVGVWGLTRTDDGSERPASTQMMWSDVGCGRGPWMPAWWEFGPHRLDVAAWASMDLVYPSQIHDGGLGTDRGGFEDGGARWVFGLIRDVVYDRNTDL